MRTSSCSFCFKELPRLYYKPAMIRVVFSEPKEKKSPGHNKSPKENIREKVREK